MTLRYASPREKDANYSLYMWRLYRQRSIVSDLFSTRRLESLTQLHQRSPLEHFGCVNTVRWNRDGSRLISGSDDRCVKVWDSSRGFDSLSLCHTVQTSHRSNIFCAELQPQNETILLSCAADGSLYLNNINNMPYGETKLMESANLMHSFLFDVDQPTILYTAEECGDISRVDLRSRSVEVLYSNRRLVRTATRTRMENWGVKALAQNSHLGSSQLFVGGKGLNIGLLDLRLIVSAESASVIQSDGSSFVKQYGPQYFSLNSPTLGPLSAVNKFCCIAGQTHPMPRTSISPNDVISISGLQISKNARSILASYQGDQIYLFDVDGKPESEVLNDKEYGNGGDDAYWRLGESSVDSDVDGVGARACLGGHINYATFLKSVAFFGPNDEYVLSGSDTGQMWIWETDSGALSTPSSPQVDDEAFNFLETMRGGGSLPRVRGLESAQRHCRVVNVLYADDRICNGIVSHPFAPILASYGIDSSIKIWGVEAASSDDEDDRFQECKEHHRLTPHQYLNCVGGEASREDVDQAKAAVIDESGICKSISIRFSPYSLLPIAQGMLELSLGRIQTMGHELHLSARQTIDYRQYENTVYHIRRDLQKRFSPSEMDKVFLPERYRAIDEGPAMPSDVIYGQRIHGLRLKPLLRHLMTTSLTPQQKNAIWVALKADDAAVFATSRPNATDSSRTLLRLSSISEESLSELPPAIVTPEEKQRSLSAPSSGAVTWNATDTDDIERLLAENLSHFLQQAVIRASTLSDEETESKLLAELQKLWKTLLLCEIARIGAISKMNGNEAFKQKHTKVSIFFYRKAIRFCHFVNVRQTETHVWCMAESLAEYRDWDIFKVQECDDDDSSGMSSGMLGPRAMHRVKRARDDSTVGEVGEGAVSVGAVDASRLREQKRSRRRWRLLDEWIVQQRENLTTAMDQVGHEDDEEDSSGVGDDDDGEDDDDTSFFGFGDDDVDHDDEDDDMESNGDSESDQVLMGNEVEGGEEESEDDEASDRSSIFSSGDDSGFAEADCRSVADDDENSLTDVSEGDQVIRTVCESDREAIIGPSELLYAEQTMQCLNETLDLEAERYLVSNVAEVVLEPISSVDRSDGESSHFSVAHSLSHNAVSMPATLHLHGLLPTALDMFCGCLDAEFVSRLFTDVDVSSHANIIAAYMQDGDYKLARNACEAYAAVCKVYRREPDVKFYFRSGCIALELGDYEEAEEALERALKLGIIKDGKADPLTQRKLKEAKSLAEKSRRQEAKKYTRFLREPKES